MHWCSDLDSERKSGCASPALAILATDHWLLIGGRASSGPAPAAGTLPFCLQSCTAWAGGTVLDCSYSSDGAAPGDSIGVSPPRAHESDNIIEYASAPATIPGSPRSRLLSPTQAFVQPFKFSVRLAVHRDGRRRPRDCGRCREAVSGCIEALALPNPAGGSLICRIHAAATQGYPRPNLPAGVSEPPFSISPDPDLPPPKRLAPAAPLRSPRSFDSSAVATSVLSPTMA